MEQTFSFPVVVGTTPKTLRFHFAVLFTGGWSRGHLDGLLDGLLRSCRPSVPELQAFRSDTPPAKWRGTEEHQSLIAHHPSSSLQSRVLQQCPCETVYVIIMMY